MTDAIIEQNYPATVRIQFKWGVAGQPDPDFTDYALELFDVHRQLHGKLTMTLLDSTTSLTEIHMSRADVETLAKGTHYGFRIGYTPPGGDTAVSDTIYLRFS